MKPGNPWSVKGIQPEAREAAKEAARRHGMTLGQWLNHVIMDSNEEQDVAEQQLAPEPPTPSQQAPVQQQSARQPLPQHPIQQAVQKQTAPAPAPAPKSQQLHDKIEDLSARLDTIVNKKSGQVDLDQWEAKKFHSSGWSDIAVRTVELPGTPEVKKQIAPESKPEVIGDRISALTDKLDSVVQARAQTKSRSDKSLMELEVALRNVINHIEVNDRQNTDVMKNIQTRLSDLSSRTTAMGPETVQRLTGTISEMDDRLSHLSQRVMKTESESSEFLSFEEKINSLANRLDNSLDRETEPQIVALEEKTNLLSFKLDDFLRTSSDTSAEEQYEARLSEISNRVESTEEHSEKLTSLEDSINQLLETVEQNRNSAQENTFRASQKSLETMETMVEQAAQKAAENAAQRSAEHVAAIMADDGLNKKEVTATITSLRDEMHKLQETTLTAAQQSAEDTISAGLGRQATKAIAEPMMVLRQEFDQLQDSSRNAELRNQDTLEAVHDTLEKVVERLVTLEATPLQQQVEISPLPSLSIPEINLSAPTKLGHSLFDADDTEEDTLPETVEDEPELAVEINPRTGAEVNPRTGAEYGIHPAPKTETTSAKSEDKRKESDFGTSDEEVSRENEAEGSSASVLNHDFLEAARRAAQAASLMPKNLPDEDEVESTTGEETTEAKNSLLAMATQSDKKRKSLLLAVAAVLLIIGALSAGSLMTNRSNTVTTSVAVPEAMISKNNSTSAAAKANRKPTDEQSGVPSKIAKPAVSPVSQNNTRTAAETSQVSKNVLVPQNSNTAVTAAVETQPLIQNSSPNKTLTVSPKATAALTSSDNTPAANNIAPANSVNVARANEATSTPVTRAVPLGALPPEAIGPVGLRRAAASGDAPAQFEIAARYTEGKLVPQNFTKAISWYQKAAAQGLAPAQYRLGTFYEKGRGVSKDKTAARNWYERAAAKGNLKAIHNLAVIHADGSKGKPDFSKAGLWFRKAAELGLADSQYNLAILHDRGLGVSKDQSKAYFWFQIAGAQGDKDARARAAVIEKRMTPDQIARTKLLIGSWNPLTLNKSANEVALPFDGWQSGGLLQSASIPAQKTSFTQKELVILAQGYLAKLGFTPGTADGILGTQTREAIEAFQQQNQLPVSGDVDPRLVSKLKAAAG